MLARWIFIIEGLLTVVIAGLGFMFMRPFPDNSKSRNLRFLSSDEQRLILARVNVDRGDASVEEFSIGKWAQSGLDWKIWVRRLQESSRTRRSSDWLTILV